MFAIEEGKVPSADARLADYGWELHEKDRAMTKRACFSDAGLHQGDSNATPTQGRTHGERSQEKRFPATDRNGPEAHRADQRIVLDRHET